MNELNISNNHGRPIVKNIGYRDSFFLTIFSIDILNEVKDLFKDLLIGVLEKDDV